MNSPHRAKQLFIVAGFIMAMTGLCRGEVVLVMGNRTDSRGTSKDYFLADRRCLKEDFKPASSGESEEVEDYVELDDTTNLADVEEHWRGTGRYQELEVYGEDPEGVSNGNGQMVRKITFLWMPVGSSPDERGRAWLEGGRLILQEAQRQEAGPWRDILAGGALLVAITHGDMYAELIAQGLLHNTADVLDDYSSFAGDSFEEGASPIVLLNFHRRRTSPGICFMDGNLLKAICGRRCVIDIHTSGVFGIASTWLDQAEIGREVKKRGGVCYISEATSKKSVRKEENVLKGVMAPALWAPRSHRPLIASLWSKAGPLCDSLGDAALEAGRDDVAHVFRGWECSVRETMEKAAKERSSRVADPRTPGLGAQSLPRRGKALRGRRKSGGEASEPLLLWKKDAATGAGGGEPRAPGPVPRVAPRAAKKEPGRMKRMFVRVKGALTGSSGGAAGVAPGAEGPRSPLLAGYSDDVVTSAASVASSVSTGTSGSYTPPRLDDGEEKAI